MSQQPDEKHPSSYSHTYSANQHTNPSPFHDSSPLNVHANSHKLYPSQNETHHEYHETHHGYSAQGHQNYDTPYTNSSLNHSNDQLHHNKTNLYSTLDHKIINPTIPTNMNKNTTTFNSDSANSAYQVSSNPFSGDLDSDFNFNSGVSNIVPTPPKPTHHTAPSVPNKDTGYRGISNTYGSEKGALVHDYDPQNEYSDNFNTFVNAVPHPFLKDEDDSRLRENTSTLVPSQDFETKLLPEPLTEQQIRLKQNEKNRLRNLRRLPRFHWTKLPYFTIIVTLIQIVVFIVELARMSILTGSAFQTQPYFNPMLGPSTYLLINMGARYVPCMHVMNEVTTDTTIQFPCANSTTVDTNVCNLSELCGLSTIKLVNNEWAPNQWYRIFIPIFLHAGFLHIIFNLLLQVVMGSSVERSIGILKYAIIYIASGIAGFLLGANFTPTGIASTGASGALFGILAVNMIMFIYCGRKNGNMYGTKHYGWFIAIMIGEIVVSLVLGLLPGMDNFSHIGGFAMGILLAIVFLPDPWFVYIDGIITYEALVPTIQQFKNNWNPMYNYKDKIASRVIIWVCARIIALALAIIYFAMLSKNFFTDDSDGSDTCKWCKYINCIPVNGWCDIGNMDITTTTTNGSGSSSSSIPQPTSTSTSTTASVPTSIENGNANDANLRRRNYDVFHDSQSNINARASIDSSSFIQQQNIGIGFYLVMGLLTLTFFKKRIQKKH